MTDTETIDDIERSEGWPEYTDRPNDLGGPTKGGITLDTLRAWRRDPALGAADLQVLRREEARAIYQFMFLQPFAAVPDAALRHYLVDLGVLRGPRKAAMMLQDILGVTADGWVGPETLKALAQPAFRKHALVMLVGSRFTHIAARVREDPTQAPFRAGWRARNARFLP